MQTLLSIVKSYFFKKGKKQFRWRKKSGQFVKKPQKYRVTVGTGFSIHHHKVRITRQGYAYGKDASEELSFHLHDKVASEIEARCDYGISEFWGTINTEVLPVDETD
jgi:hypothetical protein